MNLLSKIPPLTKPAVLITQAVTLTAAFALLAYVLNLPWLWFLFGLLLAAPAVAALRYEAWLNTARITSLIGLFIIVTGATADLWIQLLREQPVDSSLHLLVLLLGVLLAVVHQLLHDLAEGSKREETSVNGLLEAGLHGPPAVPMLCLTLVLGGAVLAYLYAGEGLMSEVFGPMLLERGVIPPITLNLFLWGMTLLAGKWLLTVMELRRAGYLQGQGQGRSGSLFSRLMDGGGEGRDSNPRSFFKQAYQLQHKKAEGQHEFATVLWQQFEAFYTLPRYISWAIPILGFIGTVLGISLAVGGLGELISNDGADFTQSLAEALRPLRIAFDTTLVALSLSIVFTFCQVMLYRWEENQLLGLTEELKNDVR